MLEIHSVVIDQLGKDLQTQHGLSVNEFDVLINLGPHESCRHGDLADRVVLSRTALTRLIDRLSSRGLVTRDEDPDDNRSIRICLTDAGRQLRRAAARTNTRVVQTQFARLSPEDLTQLQEILNRLNRFGVVT